MKKVDLAVGALVLVGLVLIVAGCVSKVAGLNLLEQFFTIPRNYFIAANTCLLLALVIDRFS